jgi:uncharacterized membrane protein YgcG
VPQRTIRSGLAALLAGLILLLALVLPASAQERITSFSSAIRLQTDGSVEVIETIEVFSTGSEIRRGIFRDIPITLINADNSRVRSNLRVIAVTRDGYNEPFSEETPAAGFKRIRIGDPDVFLTYGKHRYTVRYTMTRMGRQFDDHDELYWNATGNYWNFEISEAVASITLPEGAVIKDLTAFTGPAGSTQSDVTITRTSDNTATFRTTRPLAAGEGLTVAASFQKGILAAPTANRELLWWLSDHRELVVPAIAVFLVGLYYLFSWHAVGRDPARGTIIPLFHPPKGFSPALVHYVHRMGWDKTGWTAFTAAIFDLGVKGLVTIDNTASKLSVTSTGARDASLPPGEKLIFDHVSARGTVTVDKTSGPKLNELRASFVKVIETENREVYFRNNTLYVIVGVAGSALILLAMIWLELLDPGFLVLAVFAGIVLGILSSVVQTLQTGSALQKVFVAIWFGVIGFNFLGGAGVAITVFRLDTPFVAAASIVLLNVLFAVLMRAPTVQGRKVMDQIDGFRMYLDTAEKNRLNINDEPPMTVERFEAILPYAIALGVEEPWSDHFEGELARNAVEGVSGTYQPRFYSGSSWTGTGNFSRAVATTAGAVSAAMVAAQPSRSSGSGFSGGGGSSGGGGGGGGGGGW